MFDNVKFEGTINLGAICVAIIQLISAYTVLVRVRALIEEHNIKLKLPGGRRKSDPPALRTDQVDQVDPPALRTDQPGQGEEKEMDVK